jgi:hypothetical protein
MGIEMERHLVVNEQRDLELDPELELERSFEMGLDLK